MKKDPEVQNILNKFPKISIHSISSIDEISEEKEDVLTDQEQLKRE